MASITLGGKPVETLGELPPVGAKAPGFDLVDPDFKTISLDDYAGRKVVINIFPSIDTPICQATTRWFNEAATDIEPAVVFTVSMDLPPALKGFLAAEGIENVVMASAFRSDFPTKYEVVMKNGLWAGLLSRAVIVLDEAHHVVYTEQVAEVDDEPDYEAALAALAR